MKPDLLTCQIKHTDYPLWRAFLKKYRDRFGKLIIYFNENNRFPYLDHFMHTALSELGNVVFLDQKEIDWGHQDWRNVATNEMLRHSDSEWVASIEGDFLAKDWEKLLNAVEEASKTFDILGYQGHQGQEQHQSSYLTGNYAHPAFWFMKRDILEKTNKDFSADPQRGADHFGLITQDIERMQIPIWYTQEHGFPEEDAFHLGSINMNYLNGLNDPSYGFHRGEAFYTFNHYSMKAPVIQSPLFMDMMVRMEEKLRVKFPDVDPENCIWTLFYEYKA